MPATNEEWAAVKELILNTVKSREMRRALVSGIGELLGHPPPSEPLEPPVVADTGVAEANRADGVIKRKPGRPRKDPGAPKTVHRRRGVGLPHEDDPDHTMALSEAAGTAPKSRRKRLIRRIDFDVLETMVLRGIAAEHNS